mgnify:CR=1 FL=1
MDNIRTSLKRFLAGQGIAGPKTGPFAENLSGNPQPVTLDVWMAHALGIKQEQFNRKATHEKATKRVKQVAEILGIEPADAQAAIWTGYRAMRGLGGAPFSIMDEYLKAKKNGWKFQGIN